MTFSDSQAERYSRHFVLPEVGVAGQKRLMEARVLVIGAGALGSAALLYLAAAGVGNLGVADYDRVELSNLQRQILHRSDRVGWEKVRSAKETINALNPDVTVTCHDKKITPDNILETVAPYDFVIDGTDRFASKFLVNDACVLSKKPYSHAGAVGFEGQTMTYVPGKGPCLRCLLGDGDGREELTCASAGVLGTIPGMLGCIQATEAVKYLLGIGQLLTGRLLRIDGRGMNFVTLNTGEADPDCPLCGKNPSIRSLRDRLSDYKSGGECNTCRADGGADGAALKEIPITDYPTDRGENDLLVDLRSEMLFRFGTLPGAVNFPADREEALTSLPRDKRLCLFCQTGEVSRQTAERLAKDGYRVLHLAGGYRAYLMGNLSSF